MISLQLLQSRYWDSSRSLVSAQAIVERKCWNMRHLLARTLPYRSTVYPEIAKILRSSLSRISKDEASLGSCDNRVSLLLAEGRASRAYWTGFAVTAQCLPLWKRVHPHASDPWNRALNIGYTMLANLIRDRIKAYGLTPEIGMLHAPRDGKEPLVYDFEELFRQPVVDAAIQRLFSRRKNFETLEEKQTVSAIINNLNSRTLHRGGWWKIRSVIDDEIGNYADSLRSGHLYKPWRFSWAHKKERLR